MIVARRAVDKIADDVPEHEAANRQDEHQEDKAPQDLGVHGTSWKI
jgi:hypothetical protein